MPKITPIPANILRKVFEKAGFQCVRIEGDHFVYTKKGVLRPVVRDSGINKYPKMRRILVRLQGAPKGAYSLLCNLWCNAEDGTKDKQVGILICFRVPYTEPEGSTGFHYKK